MPSDIDRVELESFLICLAAPFLVLPWLVWCGWCAFEDWKAGR